jgi:hypothetical protein
MNKTAKFRRLASTSPSAASETSTTDATLVSAEVLAVQAPHRLQCLLADQPVDVDLATHLPTPMPGQRVLVAMAHTDAPLIVAAYPLAGPQTAASTAARQPPIQLDPATGVLRIEAPHLQLAGLASVELRCGSATLLLNVQGEVMLQAEAITQSAIGAYRIEGASIDLN